MLQIHQRRLDRRQSHSLRTKQKIAQVGRLAHEVPVQSSNISKPCSSHQILNKREELTKAVGNPRSQLNIFPVVTPAIKEIKGFSAYLLETP